MQYRIKEATKRYEDLLKEASTVKTMLIISTIAYTIITVKVFTLLFHFLFGGVTFGL